MNALNVALKLRKITALLSCTCYTLLEEEHERARFHLPLLKTAYIKCLYTTQCYISTGRSDDDFRKDVDEKLGLELFPEIVFVENAYNRY